MEKQMTSLTRRQVELLRHAVSTRQLYAMPLVDRLDNNEELTTDELSTLRDTIVGDELVERGFPRDAEVPNSYGLELEDLIDALSEK